MSLFWRKLLVRTGIAPWLPWVQRSFGNGEAFLRYFSDRTLSIPLQAILDPTLFPEIHAPDAIDLALPTPRCDLPLGALRGIHEPGSISVWGLPELREVIRNRQQTQPGCNPQADEAIGITHGATGAFGTVLDTFINPGSPVVIFDPTSPIFAIGLNHRRARIRWIPSHLEDGWLRFPLEQFTAALRGAKLLVLTDPGTPHGGLFSPEDLEQIAFWAKKRDVLIYLDQVFDTYRDPTNGVPSTSTILDRLPATQNRLLVADSVSKAFGLAATRVGWLRGNRHLLQACMTTSAMVAPFVSPVAQHLALAALQSGNNYLPTVAQEYTQRRQFAYEQLREMGLQPVGNRAGYFFWVPIVEFGMTSKEFSRRLVETKRVLVNPGEPFGPSGKDYIRISLATDPGRLQEGFRRLAEFLREVRSETATLPTPTPRPPEVIHTISANP